MKRFITAMILITSAGLFYVYEEVEAVKIGYTIRKQEETKTLMLDRTRALKYNIARLKAPNNLEKKLLAQRIVLEPPKSWQTIVMPGTAPSQKPDLKPPVNSAPFFTKFLIGTAQAESRESAN